MLLQTDMRALIFIVAWVHVLLHQEAVQYVGCCMGIYLESTMAQEMVLLLIMEMESTLTIFI